MPHDPESVAEKISQTNTFWVGEKDEQSPSLVRMGLYNLRFRGIGTLSKQVWIYFRRMLSPLFPYSKPGYSSHEQL